MDWIIVKGTLRVEKGWLHGLNSTSQNQTCFAVVYVSLEIYWVACKSRPVEITLNTLKYQVFFQTRVTSPFLLSYSGIIRERVPLGWLLFLMTCVVFSSVKVLIKSQHSYSGCPIIYFFITSSGNSYCCA
jgi:hypothetical protein